MQLPLRRVPDADHLAPVLESFLVPIGLVRTSFGGGEILENPTSFTLAIPAVVCMLGEDVVELFDGATDAVVALLTIHFDHKRSQSTGVLSAWPGLSYDRHRQHQNVQASPRVPPSKRWCVLCCLGISERALQHRWALRTTRIGGSLR